MRAEDKELEGPELAQELQREVIEEVSRDEEMPVLAGEEMVDIELAHESRVFAALEVILAGEEINISLLYLPKRETEALEFLKTAVSGRDVHMGQFVYAEDRAAMLEQSLAVLQQNLTHGSAAALGELHAKFGVLAGRLAELRDQLRNLEDAQDELERAPAEVAKAETADADKPAGETDESLTGFIASALQALAKVANTEPAMIASSLDGPELPDVERPASTLVGNAVVETPKAPSSLTDGAVRHDVLKLPSTLSGPERPEAPKPLSTLSGPEPPMPPATTVAPRRSTLYSEGLTRALIKPPEMVSDQVSHANTPGDTDGPDPDLRARYDLSRTRIAQKTGETKPPATRKSSPSIAVPDIKPEKKPDKPDKPKGKKRG